MIYNEDELKREILMLNAIVKAQTTYISDFKLKLEAEYQRGRDSILSRTCESCEHFTDGICYSNLVCLMNGGEYLLTAKEFSCGTWKQK